VIASRSKSYKPKRQAGIGGIPACVRQSKIAGLMFLGLFTAQKVTALSYAVGVTLCLHPAERVRDMDDVLAINIAKSEFREAYNTADVNRLLALSDPGIVDFTDGAKCGFGQDALRARLESFFQLYRVHLSVIEIEIRTVGHLAYDYGWHVWSLSSKNGGGVVDRKDRYVDIWRKNENGEWKLWMYMDNRDLGPS
jgi:ketosteroid isomerase-like protein